MFPITLPVSPERIAFLQAETGEEAEYQESIQQARDYDDGIQFVALTERLREFLGGDTANDAEDFKRLRLNITRTVNAAVSEKLLVNNFDSDETGQKVEAPDATGGASVSIIKPVADWAWKIWRKNKMDAKQKRVHDATVRDGEAFVIVDWDNVTQRPRFTPHQRFVDVSTSARADLGEGCRAFYRNDDTDQDLLFVTKRWTEVLTTPEGVRRERQRLTVYLPDRIMKFAGFPGAWEKTVDDDTEPWPIPWVDKKGLPLGIPVAHFTSSAGMEAREAWPLQNAINKALVDLMTESDVSAFRIFLAFGWKPVDSDGNPLEISAGKWLGSPSKDATATVIPGGDLSQFMNLIEGIMSWCAIVTDTPISRFIVTKQIAAEGTQKQQEGPLLTKVRNRQGEIGNGWERCMEIARRLENTYGKGGLDEAVEIYTGWAPAEARDEDAEIARAQKKQQLGVPYRQILLELGYDLAQIAEWDQERQQKEAADRAALAQSQANNAQV